MPIFTSGKPKLACSAATAMSHIANRPMPPARQWPLTRAIIGIVVVQAKRSRSANSACGTDGSNWNEPAPLPRSAPAQKALSPAPVSTTTRISLSDMACVSPGADALQHGLFMALRCAGRSMVSHSAWPRCFDLQFI